MKNFQHTVADKKQPIYKNILSTLRDPTRRFEPFGSLSQSAFEQIQLKKLSMWLKEKQDGRLAPAYFSPNYKYFDHFLQTVKNKTTVLILVFKEFLQTSIPPLISVLYAKGYHSYPLQTFCLTVPKNFVQEPFCVSQNFWHRKKISIRGDWEGEYQDFPLKIFCLTVPRNFAGEPFCVVFQKISGSKKFYG